MTWAFESLLKLGGLEKEKDYPYKARGGKCAFKKEKTVVQLDHYLNLTVPGAVPKNAEDLIKRYVAEHGPVSIAINANMMQVKD